MLSKEEITTIIDNIKRTHKSNAANVHTYTNKVETMKSMIDLHDMLVDKGRDTASIDTKIYNSMMDTFKWLDREYNKPLYNKEER